MPNLTILPLNRTIDAAQGASILQAILAAGIETVHEKLDAIVGVGSKSRLACQALIGTDDVTVELLGFASGA